MEICVSHSDEPGDRERAESTARTLEDSLDSLQPDLAVTVLPAAKMAPIEGMTADTIASALDELATLRSEQDSILSIKPYRVDIGFGIEVTVDSNNLVASESATLKVLYAALKKGPVLFKLSS